MLGRMIRKLFSRDEEVDVTEQSFGKVVSLRVGGSVSISPTFMLMLDDKSLFKANYGTNDYSSMIISTILSFTFEGITVYRLYCDNPQCMVQVSEEANGSVSYMLFMLTQEVQFENEDDYGSWYEDDDSVMRSHTVVDDKITDEDVEFEKVFGPMNYREQKEADGTAAERPAAISKAMSLFAHDSGDTIDYALFDFEVDAWFVEGFSGIDVPSEEVTIR